MNWGIIVLGSKVILVNLFLSYYWLSAGWACLVCATILEMRSRRQRSGKRSSAKWMVLQVVLSVAGAGFITAGMSQYF